MISPIDTPPVGATLAGFDGASKLKVDFVVDVSIYGLSIFCLLSFGYRAIGTAL
jgi:hypothetical protein